MARGKQRTLKAKKGKLSVGRRQHLAMLAARRRDAASGDASVNGSSSTSTMEVDTMQQMETSPIQEPAQPSEGAQEPPQPSASQRKLSLLQTTGHLEPEPVSTTLPTTIVDLNNVATLFNGLLCPTCMSPELTLQADNTRSKAFAVHLKVICTACGHIPSEGSTSETTSVDRAMEVNRKTVAAALTLGLGYAGLMKLSEVIGMPRMHQKTFQAHSDAIYGKVPDASTRTLEYARTQVIKHYQQYDPSAFDGDVLNVPVAFDGTWETRGHKSKVGCAAVIEVMTGLVIDYHVMSLYCQTCATTGQRMKAKGDEVYAVWLEAHNPVCQKNYEGSSGGMEVAAAKVMWTRSLGHGMRYTVLIGDGDTKTFSAITALNPYGDEHPVVKEECVNHVAKRLYTALKNLVSTCSKKSVTLGGKQRGALTQNKIGFLQSYYTKAVRTFNKSTEEMSRAVWAAYQHSTAPDTTYQHEDCPTAEKTWCWYQRARNEGVDAPTRAGRLPVTYLCPRVAEYVKPIYERLTSPDLLSRCLLGKTQNVNESLHSLIWARCPKHKFAGLRRVQLATLLAVGEFNMGSVSTRQLLLAIGCKMGPSTAILGHQRDSARIKKAERAQEEVEKKRREVRKAAQQKEQADAETREGGASYISGGF